MKNNAILIELGLLIVLALVGNAAQFYSLGFIDHHSKNLYDYSMQLTMPGTVDERLTYYRINSPAADWDGVFAFKTK